MDSVILLCAPRCLLVQLHAFIGAHTLKTCHTAAVSLYFHAVTVLLPESGAGMWAGHLAYHERPCREAEV